MNNEYNTQIRHWAYNGLLHVLCDYHKDISKELKRSLPYLKSIDETVITNKCKGLDTSGRQQIIAYRKLEIKARTALKRERALVDKLIRQLELDKVK